MGVLKVSLKVCGCGLFFAGKKNPDCLVAIGVLFVPEAVD